MALGVNASGGTTADLNSTRYDNVEEELVQLCLEDLGSVDAMDWIREAVRVLLSSAILLSNSLIVVAVLRAWWREGKPLGTRAAAPYLILNLAVADALFGFAMLYGWIQDVVCCIFNHMIKHPFTCMLGHVTTQFFDSTSCVTIVVIAVNSALSVSHSARYRNFLTPRRTVIVIVCTWITGLFLALTVFMIPDAFTWQAERGCQLNDPYEDSMLWSTVFVLLTALFCCYWRIHRVTLEMVQRGALPAPRRHASTKAARMLLLIFAWDSFAYFPLLIVTLVMALNVKVSVTLAAVASNLTLFTFLADPYIYAYNNQQTKKAIADLIACIRREHSQEGAVLDDLPANRRISYGDNSLSRVRQMISTHTNSSSTGEDEKTNRQSPTVKRKSLGP